MKQRIFLTGHRGYLGACLAHLIQHDPTLTLITTDERLETLEKSSIACDGVIHTVCRRSNASGDNLHELERDNENATRALIASLQRSTPIIYTSSIWVYGNATAPVAETTPPMPCQTYGLSKYKTERLLTESEHSASLLRLGALWGFGYHRQGRTFLDVCIARVKAQQTITLFKEPALRAPLFVWDAARWIHLMVKQSLHVPVLNMAGESIVLQEKAERLCAHAPDTYTPTITWAPGKVEAPHPLMNTRLWQSLCKKHEFALTPWSALEQIAWQEKKYDDVKNL